MAERIVSRPGALPLGPVRGRGMGWNGMVMLVAAEAALFGYLLFSYYYMAVSNPPGWVIEARPSLKLALPIMAALMLADLGLGLLSRVAPQFNLFALEMPAKMMLGLLALALSLPVLVPRLAALFRTAPSVMTMMAS